jgi:hypothetical protein
MSNTFSPLRQVSLTIALIIIPIVIFVGCTMATASASPSTAAGLGDLTAFKTIVVDVQGLVDKGDVAGAQTRITDYETAWDQAETAIRPLDQTAWSNIDRANDAVFTSIRASTPDPAAMKAALATLVATLNDPTKAP